MYSRCIDNDEPVSKEDGIDAYWNSPLLSLERSVGPLLDHGDNLTVALITAKERYKKSSHTLKEDESAAIYLYTMEIQPESVYTIINKHLRNNDSTSALPWFSYIKLLCTAIKKLPSYSGSVWRGVRGDVAK
jgi:hypothetical protein